MKVLIVVDVQNDFCEGGALGVPGGTDVAAGVQAYLAKNRHSYGLVVTSQDWHTAGETNGGHFAVEGQEPDFIDTWPVHCVAGDPGAAFHEAVHPALPMIDVRVRKGMGVPAYSAFEGFCADSDHALMRVLERFAASKARAGAAIEVDVVGLAADYCVAATALDAVRVPGVRAVRILERLTAPVNAETWNAVRRPEVEKAGVRIV